MRLFSAAALLATVASAQLVTYDVPGQQIRHSLSVPDSTASSGSGPIFFQLMGPESFQWIALGFGEEMAGSHIFVMYKDGTGNVTVSPRIGEGEFEPEFDPSTEMELLEGTGIVDGMMVANVKCMNCESWRGGSVNFNSDSESFIEAFRTGRPINMESPQAELEQHQQIGHTFTINMTAARGGSPVNPFSPEAMATETAATGPAAQGQTVSGGGSSGMSNTGMLLKAHGIIMGLTAVILLPLGALSMRVFGFGGLIWAHAAWQLLSGGLFIAGFALGYVVAGDLGIRYMGPGATHTIFGTVIFAFFWLQPFLGLGHHLKYRSAGSRTAVSHAHIWWGRIVIIMAIINGGLGLKLAANSPGGEIAYGVLAGVIGLVYIAVATLGEFTRAKREKATPREVKPMSEAS